RPAGPSLVSPGTHSAAAPATWNRRQRNWLASTGLQLHPAPAKESGLCGHVRPRSQWWEDDHTRRPGAEDVWTFSAPERMESGDPPSPSRLYFLGRVPAQSAAVARESVHGKRASGSGQARPCLARRLVALCPLWSQTPRQL